MTVVNPGGWPIVDGRGQTTPAMRVWMQEVDRILSLSTGGTSIELAAVSVVAAAPASFSLFSPVSSAAVEAPDLSPVAPSAVMAANLEPV